MIASSMIVLLGLPAWAGSIRPSRHPLPARLVERGLVEPQGWTRLELTHSRREARGAFGDAPSLLELPPPDLERLGVAVRYGVLPRVELQARLGWAWLAVEGARAAGVADPELGVRVSLLDEEPPGHSVAAELAVSTPAAPVVDGLPLGTGVTAARARLGGRTRWGALGLTGWLGGEAQLPGHVGWLPTEAGAAQWLDAGDRVDLDGSVLLQAGPLALEALGGGGVRGVATLATARGRRAVVVDAGAVEVDLGARATVQLTRGFDLAVAMQEPVVGDGAALLPADSLTPARGRWVTLRVGASL